MVECVCLPKCPFFNDKMADNDGLADLYKNRYCKGNWDNCARHMIFSVHGKEAVPADLYPNMQDRAQEILAKLTV